MTEKSTIDIKEIDNFSSHSDNWWDDKGAFAPLHKLNPTRLEYIKSIICKHYNRDYSDAEALNELNIADIGCGGGIVCEPMARLRATVTGVDADLNAINIANDHAKSSDLNITYINSSIEQLEMDEKYDVVLALEIIEHVSNVDEFIKGCNRICKKGGIIIFSTLNRNAKSYALGIIAAEHILKWVPKNTHQWKKFIKPSELAKKLRENMLTCIDICGISYDLIENDFKLDKNDLDVNYFMSATKTENDL